MLSVLEGDDNMNDEVRIFWRESTPRNFEKESWLSEQANLGVK